VVGGKRKKGETRRQARGVRGYEMEEAATRWPECIPGQDL